MSDLSLLFSNLGISTIPPELKYALEIHDINECPDSQCELCSILICPARYKYHLHPHGCKMCINSQ